VKRPRAICLASSGFPPPAAPSGLSQPRFLSWGGQAMDRARAGRSSSVLLGVSCRDLGVAAVAAESKRQTTGHASWAWERLLASTGQTASCGATTIHVLDAGWGANERGLTSAQRPTSRLVSTYPRGWMPLSCEPNGAAPSKGRSVPIHSTQLLQLNSITHLHIEDTIEHKCRHMALAGAATPSVVRRSRGARRGASRRDAGRLLRATCRRSSRPLWRVEVGRCGGG
jgi:hypothetical protein